ncbi:hypothetical protein SLS58_009527 [Diplodia intermedia]|uniref:Heterokaryon incompatibility domain-containing protein n=1 Tax=Diplodia intermedia TaxID=856260 RepID=A0ABR3TC81_9PEZI
MFPCTLQDAITVTRNLGLNFIWIDSACIIQNDEEDKRREIAKMRRIYANSYVTIVASTARTAADGFLQDREPPPPLVKVPFPCAGGSLGSMYLRGRVSSGWTQYDVSSLQTDKRAWTMEEFSRLSGYRYRAGLWRETLAYDLLWKEDNPVDVPVPGWSTWRSEASEFFLENARQATAPTWSWARGHCQITTWMHGRIDFSDDFAVVDCNSTLQSAERPYGDVLSGRLTLRGRMKQLFLLDSHKVQYLGRSIWKTGEDMYYTIGTANLDPFRPHPARDPHASGKGSRQLVLLFNFGTYNDDHENVGLVLSPLAGSESTAAGRTSHTRMGIYTLWSMEASEFESWDVGEVMIT